MFSFTTMFPISVRRLAGAAGTGRWRRVLRARRASRSSRSRAPARRASSWTALVRYSRMVMICSSVRAFGVAYTAAPGNWAPSSRPVRRPGGVYTGRRHDVTREEGALDGDSRSALTGPGLPELRVPLVRHGADGAEVPMRPLTLSRFSSRLALPNSAARPRLEVSGMSASGHSLLACRWRAGRAGRAQ